MRVIMGRAFAFIHRELAAQDLTTLDPERHHLVCTLGQQTDLEEFTLPGQNLPLPPNLLVVTCDKDLYYENRDSIHLLLYDPLAANTQLTILLQRGTSIIRRLTPTLGEFGQGTVVLDGLPVGDYSVFVGTESLCSFQVAAYSLAPLVGTLTSQQKEGDFLDVSLQIESYGIPLEGGVWVTLRSDNYRRRTLGLAQGGHLEARLELTGDGPFVIDLQHAEQTELTATVPLPGTRRAERVEVPLSGLRTAWQASRLPSLGSVAVRDLHLSKGKNRGAPFDLERVGTGQARLKALRPLRPASVAVIDPCRGELFAVHSWEEVEEGQVLEFPVPSPTALLAVGTYLEDKPWEGWAMTIAPSQMNPELVVPASVEAGQKIEIEVRDVGNSAVYVLLKDARLHCQDRPASRLASRLLEHAKTVQPRRRTGTVSARSGPPKVLASLRNWKDSGGTLTTTQEQRALRLARWVESTGDAIVSQLVGLSVSEFRAKVLGFDASNLATVNPNLVRCVPESLARRYCCLPVARRGTNGLVLAMSDTSDFIAIDDMNLITGYEIHPISVDEEEILRAMNQFYGVTDLVEVEETVKDISAQDFGCLDFEEEIELDRLRENVAETAGEAPESDCQGGTLSAGWLEPENGVVKLAVPSPESPAEFLVEVFVAGHLDWTATQGRVVTSKPLAPYLELPPFVHPQDKVEGRLRIVKGQPPFRLTVTRDGELLELPEVVENLEPLSFPCVPGRYHARVEEITTGRHQSAYAQVEQAGCLSGIKRTVEWLTEGNSLSRAEDSSILGLRVLETLEGPAARLASATANYSHLCCEQTAAKILSACSLWMRSSNGNRGRLESIIAAGVARERKMLIPGRGFSSYPGGSDPSPHWGPKAARYLCQLQIMRGCAMAPEFAQVIEEGIELGLKGVQAHGLSWPPTSSNTAYECYLKMVFGEAEVTALERVEEGFPDTGWGRVGVRTANAFRAACLVRGRQSLPLAIELANEVFSDIGSSGMLYSTADSIATMALFSELESFLRAPGEVQLQGESGELDSIQVLSGEALVEVSRSYLEDWSSLTSNCEVEVQLSQQSARAGEQVTLHVRIPEGYQMGDLVWVCLPKALALVKGGGQVRRFSVDFEARDSLVLSLVALAPTADQGETVMVCLRNMFREERVGLASPLAIRVSPANVSPPGALKLPPQLCRVELTRHGLRGTPRTLQEMQTLSGRIHGQELVELCRGILERAQERGASQLLFDWLDEGVARCRIKTRRGIEQLLRYPGSLQALIVGRLQMLSQNALGACGPQSGEVEIQGQSWPVTILPTAQGMTAALKLKDDPADNLLWLKALSSVQAALEEERPPDLESLREAKPDFPDPVVDELLEVLSQSPVSANQALALLARLATPQVV